MSDERSKIRRRKQEIPKKSQGEVDEEEEEDDSDDVEGYSIGGLVGVEKVEGEVEQLLSQDNEMDLIFFSFTRLLEDLRRQSLDYGYMSSSDDGEEEEVQ